VPLYRGTRYPLLAAGGIRRPVVPPEALNGTEEAAEGADLGTPAAADNAEPQAGAAPAGPIRGVLERTSSATRTA
jgi:hypothetical protein